MMLARQFYDVLTAEVLNNTMELHPELHQELRRYYRALADRPEYRDFHRYSWTRRTAPMAHLLKTLPRRNVPWRVLDAGCGLGTESIFWSALRDDIQVVGVDLSSRRLDVAEARRTAYERHLGRPLQARFLEQDVFTILATEHFDVVWTMEAISHIDPAEKFLANTSENLGDRGHIVISDSHIWNPAMAWRVFRLRRKGVALHTHKATSTGEPISYAQERLFTVGQLSRMLKQGGFSSVKAQLSVFFPPSLAQFPRLFSFCTWSDTVLNKVPLIRNLGGIYTIVAAKQQ